MKRKRKLIQQVKDISCTIFASFVFQNVSNQIPLTLFPVKISNPLCFFVGHMH